MQRPRRSKDGASATKNHEHHYGYKAHTLVNEIKIIEKLLVTPTNMHDLHIEPSLHSIVCCRDKGYFGSTCKYINSIMDQSISSHLLPVKSISRNLRISCIRSMAGHKCAFMNELLNLSITLTPIVQRVYVKTYYTAMCYNLLRARFPDRKA